MIKTMIVDLPALVPILEQISATVWPDEPFNGRRIANKVTYLLNEELYELTTELHDIDEVCGTDVEEQSVNNKINAIIDLIGDFLIRYKLDVGICVGIVLQSATGIVILNFGEGKQ